jgi:hypothetical protein
MAPKQKRQTRKKMSKIWWNGRGSRMDMTHTKNEFLKIMRKEFPDVVYWRMKGDVGVIPGKIKKDDLAGWMTYTGAHYV